MMICQGGKVGEFDRGGKTRMPTVALDHHFEATTNLTPYGILLSCLKRSSRNAENLLPRRTSPERKHSRTLGIKLQAVYQNAQSYLVLN